MEKFEVPAEYYKSVPARVKNRFAPFLATLDKMEKQVSEALSHKKRHECYSNINQCSNFFHREVAKLMIDFYAETMMRKDKIIDMTFEINGGIKVIELRVFDVKQERRILFGKAGQWIESGELDSWSARGDVVALKTRISNLYGYRAVFHHFLKNHQWESGRTVSDIF